MRTRVLIAGSLSLALAVSAATPIAHASMVAGALESTQLANFVQLVTQAGRAIKQLVTLKRQLETMVKQAKRFGELDFRDLRSLAIHTQSMYGAVNGLYHSSLSTSERFQQLYPGHKAELQNFDQKVQALSKQKQESTERALKHMEMTFKNVQSDQKMYDSLKRKLDGGDLGRNQLLDICARTLLEIHAQLVQLKSVLAASVHLDAVHRRRPTRRARRDLAGTATRRHIPLRRTRPLARPPNRPLATPTQPTPTALRRRLQPHPGHRRDHQLGPCPVEWWK